MLRSLFQGGRNDFDEVASTSAIVRDEVRAALRGWVLNKLPGGRWRMAPPEIRAQLEAIEAAGPPDPTRLRTVSGRQLRKMNSALRDTGAPGERHALAQIHLHTGDADAAGIRDGASIRVTSANGSVVGRAKLDDSVRRGAIWVPHGWPELKIGELTSAARDLDPLTGMVVQTGLEVRISAA